MEIIGHIETDFTTKFGVPRQSGLLPQSVGRIVFEKDYGIPSAFKGLEGFSHIWVIWEFSELKRKKWSPTVRPPILGGNKRVGVFATRSPYRPNPIAMSVLKIESIEATESGSMVLIVSGCDMMNNTPIFDIKPYLPYVDSVPNARGGFTENLPERQLKLKCDDEAFKKIPSEKRAMLKAILSGDPRPSYQDDPDRVYGFEFAGFEVKFTVCNGTVSLKSAEKIEKI